MIDLSEIIRRLTATAQIIRAMTATISDEQAQWKPDAETWSMLKVMEHMYNEERIDFRRHLREMFATPKQPWAPWSAAEDTPISDFHTVLESFFRERDDSLAWLKALQSPNWDISQPAPWGEIRAGDVLFSWPAHDALHIRQLNELLYAWNAHTAAPYSVQYAGEW